MKCDNVINLKRYTRYVASPGISYFVYVCNVCHGEHRKPGTRDPDTGGLLGRAQRGGFVCRREIVASTSKPAVTS